MWADAQEKALSLFVGSILVSYLSLGGVCGKNMYLETQQNFPSPMISNGVMEHHQYLRPGDLTTLCPVSATKPRRHVM